MGKDVLYEIEFARFEVLAIDLLLERPRFT
jgi:hypothetical protein